MFVFISVFTPGDSRNTRLAGPGSGLTSPGPCPGSWTLTAGSFASYIIRWSEGRQPGAALMNEFW